MRARTGMACAAVSLSAGALLAACVDLLHSTMDVLTACELDAAQPGCGETVETDFCAWTPTEARQHAVHACAWLGACETPTGSNAFGPCVFQALLAYDCTSNPNHRAQRNARDLWACLQRVASCADVDKCIFPTVGPPGCEEAGVYTNCKGDVRVHCADGGVEPYSKARGEDCALWGKTCAIRNGTSVCAGDMAGIDCDANACVGTTLRRCVAPDDGGPSIDHGIDCASNGASACQGFPFPDAARWVACKAGGDALTDENDCEPDPSATCANGRAKSCPSGRVETIDCATLLGSDGSANACSEGPLAFEFDWTSPCALTTPECASDSCDAGTVTSCERGAAFSVNCQSEGLNGCRLQTADPGSIPRAACAPP
jgi:hypothetical protein